MDSQIPIGDILVKMMIYLEGKYNYNIRFVKFKIVMYRPSMKVGSYYSNNKHHHRVIDRPLRYWNTYVFSILIFINFRRRLATGYNYSKEGLNTLKYKLIKKTFHKLYTNITVNII